MSRSFRSALSPDEVIPNLSGLTEGKYKRSNALTVGLNDLSTEVSGTIVDGGFSGFTGGALIKSRHGNAVIVCRVKFAEWTRDDRRRQPVFLGIREDRDAKEVIRE